MLTVLGRAIRYFMPMPLHVLIPLPKSSFLVNLSSASRLDSNAAIQTELPSIYPGHSVSLRKNLFLSLPQQSYLWLHINLPSGGYAVWNRLGHMDLWISRTWLSGAH